MKPFLLKSAGVAFLLSLSGLTHAQAAVPPGARPDAERRAQHEAMMMQHESKRFGAMSAAGRTVMRDAMMAGDRRAAHMAVKAGRDQMMALLMADQLDVAALRRAMEAERAAADTMRAQHQAVMIAAFQKLSVADRKAFAQSARGLREKMAMRMEMRHMGPDGADDMPPPPPPPRP